MSIKVPKYEGPYGEEFDAAYDKFEAVIEEFKATIEDGFNLSDIVKWFSIASKSYDIATEIFPEGPDREKTVEVARYTYWAIDPDLPWIPEFAETPLERSIIINIVLPMAINAAWDAIENYKAK